MNDTNVKHWLADHLAPFVQRAARSYIAGEHVDDALCVAAELQGRGIPSTLGYWDGDGEHPDAVMAQYLDALRHLSASPLDSYLSIKLPSLGYSLSRVEPIVSEAAQLQRRIHFDALEVDSVNRTWSLIEALPDKSLLRCTLPGRWRRSVIDVAWVVSQQLAVRVVKGQFPDPMDRQRDPKQGFLEVIDRLAGRAKHVSVASHEPALIEEALGRLTRAGTSCDLELLYGLAWRRGVRIANKLGVPARVYVPYGVAYLPYCLKEARRSPRLMGRAMLDALQQLLPTSRRPVGC